MERFPKLVSCIINALESSEDSHDKEAIDGGCGLRPVPLLQLHLAGSKPMYQPYKGQLQLSIYYYDGIITVHVLSARDLCNATMPSTTTPTHHHHCSTYVKLSLLPSRMSATHKSHWRSDVVPQTSDPMFQWTWDEQFSIELSESAIELSGENDVDEEISKGRLLVTVWHREPAKGTKRKRRQAQETTRLLGCMSFSLKNIKQKRQVIDEWFYLLSEELGLWKHLASENNALSSTFLTKPPALSQLRKSKRRSSTSSYQQPTTSYQQPGDNYSQPTSSYQQQRRASFPPQQPGSTSQQPRTSLPAPPTSSKLAGAHPRLSLARKRSPSELKSCMPHQKSCIPRKKRNVTFVTSPPRSRSKMSSTTATSSTISSMEETDVPLVGRRKKLFVHRGRQGYGLSLTGEAPPVVSSVTSCSEAWMAGVHVGDCLLGVGRQNVQHMSGVEAAQVIKKQQKQGIILEIIRPTAEPKDQLSQKSQANPASQKTQSLHSSQADCNQNKENHSPQYVLVDQEDIQIHRPADQDEIFAQCRNDIQVEQSTPLKPWEQYPNHAMSEPVIV